MSSVEDIENLRMRENFPIFCIAVEICYFQNHSHFHTNWLIFEGLATKVNLSQIQKYLGFG
jgi:hypothetical protein